MIKRIQTYRDEFDDEVILAKKEHIKNNPHGRTEELYDEIMKKKMKDLRSELSSKYVTGKTGNPNKVQDILGKDHEKVLKILGALDLCVKMVNGWTLRDI